MEQIKQEPQEEVKIVTGLEPNIAQKYTQRAILDNNQPQIEKINQMIKDAANQGKTWANVTSNDIEMDNISGSGLAWYYRWLGYNTLWYSQHKLIKISWK